MRIKKRLLSVFTALLICAAAMLTAYADSMPARVIDNAGLLSQSEESALASRLDSISGRHNMDIMIATENSLGGRSIERFADDLINSSTKSRGGIILFIEMESREWYISANGYGKTAVTDAGREYMANQFTGELSGGNYAEAFMIFAQQCDEFLIRAESGDPYDESNLPKKPFPVVKNLLIAIVIGFVLALIISLIIKGQNKSVRFQRAANSYVRQGSLNVTERRDLFLYSTIDRREIPKSSSSNDGGNGNRGGGGSF